MTMEQTLSLKLSEDERDCLQELMNISYGEATAAIAKVIDRYATLDIPKIGTATNDEFREYFLDKFDNNNIYYVSNQSIDGHISGENMFIMDQHSLTNLAKEFGLHDDEINQDELKDVILEISNMVTSTTLKKLAELLEAKIIFSPPSTKIIHKIDNLNNRYETHDQHIIIISSMIQFEQQDIQGELLIITRDDSFMYIKKALDKILEEY